MVSDQENGKQDGGRNVGGGWLSSGLWSVGESKGQRRANSQPLRRFKIIWKITRRS